MRVRASFAIVICAAACGQSHGDASVELGTGETRFEVLRDDQELPLVAGPQGGFHIWVSFRARGLSSTRALLEIDAVPLDATEPPPERAPVRVVLEELEDGTMELVGWPAVLPTECYAGRPLSVRVTLTDSSGQTCSDESVVIATAPEQWLTEC